MSDHILSLWRPWAAVFIPLFTHGGYTPPDCAAPRAEWPAPDPRSIAHDWALCCGDEWMLASINSAYFVGAFLGASAGGVLSDLWGRALYSSTFQLNLSRFGHTCPCAPV
jgi:MFS family permease